MDRLAMDIPVLKECPFCGGEAVMLYSDQSIVEERVHCMAKCADSSCQGSYCNTWQVNEQDAADHWNKRSTKGQILPITKFGELVKFNSDKGVVKIVGLLDPNETPFRENDNFELTLRAQSIDAIEEITKLARECTGGRVKVTIDVKRD